MCPSRTRCAGSLPCLVSSLAPSQVLSAKTPGAGADGMLRRARESEHGSEGLRVRAEDAGSRVKPRHVCMHAADGTIRHVPVSSRESPVISRHYYKQCKTHYRN